MIFFRKRQLSELDLCPEDVALLEATTTSSATAATAATSATAGSFCSPLGDRMPTVTFTQEEFKFIDFIRKCRGTIVGRIDNAYCNEEHREELTSILMSK